MGKGYRFVLDSELMRLVVVLRRFYEFTTNNKLFPLLVMLSVADVASLPENPGWTDQQKAAWEECKKAKVNLGQAIVLRTAEDVLADRNPTAHTLYQMSKKQLVKMANRQGISPEGLRKSGIIRKLIDARK